MSKDLTPQEGGRFPGEVEDLERAGKIADKWGYGNCISYLKDAWARKLVEDGYSPATAARSTFMSEDEVTLFCARIKAERSTSNQPHSPKEAG